MRKYFLISLAIVATFCVGRAEAQQWGDITQYSNSLGPDAFNPSNIPATDAYVQSWSVNCPAGMAFPSVVEGSPARFAATNCQNNRPLDINLNQFARQSDVFALQTQFVGMNTSLASFQTQINTFTTEINQINQSLHIISLRADQGVAMSMAMAGVADLQSDEHFAVSANWGTFRGQNGVAVGVAYRVADHASVNGGFVGSMNGGPVAARAGIRYGW